MKELKEEIKALRAEHHLHYIVALHCIALHLHCSCIATVVAIDAVQCHDE